MTPQEYCEARTRGAGSSFYYALVMLPPKPRRAMMALYAFCREVDDIADRTSHEEVALAKLGFWRNEIARAFEGIPQHPVAKEIAWAKEHYPLDLELFVEILDGMQMDIARVPIRTRADLGLYCYRVAGAVGLLSIEIFGYRDRQSRRFALLLGEALQLTNILRDLAEDAAHGRIYIPEEDRRAFGVDDADFRQGRLHDGMRALLAQYADLAARRYREAIEALPAEDRASLRASIVMGAIYRAQLARFVRIGFDVWRRSAHISPLRKLWIAWRCWRAEARNKPLRW